MSRSHHEAMAFRYSFILALLAALVLFANIASAASATSFCKCTCQTNSTIIPLRYVPAPPPSPSDLADNETTHDPPPRRTGTCADCNRQFCIDNRVNAMPICKESKDDQIFTECFQRDSAKDEGVVYGFIIITVGLFVYSAVRPWLHRRVEERRGYAGVSSGQGNS